MSELKISQFIAATGGTRAHALYYVPQNNHDLEKAKEAFFKATPEQRDAASKKVNTYYAGGSSSGVAMVMPGEEGAELTPVAVPLPAQPQQAFSGQARTLSGGSTAAPVTAAASGPFVAKRTDYTTPDSPKTRIRFELPTGQMLMLSVSLSATVGDLKGYILENYPDATGLALRVVAPERLLDDDSATVDAAGLKMSMVRCTCSS